MPQLTQPNPVAQAYAKALLELASAQSQDVAVGDELSGISEVLAENKTFGAFLKDPGVSQEERGNLLRRVFGGRVSPLVLNTLLVMNQKGRSAQIGAFLEAYDALLEEKLGKIEVDVTVPQRLSDMELDEVRQLVNRALQKDAVVHQYVDESIIGGLILRVGDRLIDGSVRSQLEQMKAKLSAKR